MSNKINVKEYLEEVSQTVDHDKIRSISKASTSTASFASNLLFYFFFLDSRSHS
jgi:hypothetical protein